MTHRPTIDLAWMVLGLQAQAKALASHAGTLAAHVDLLVDHMATTADELIERERIRAGELDEPLGIGGPSCRHHEDFRLDAGSMRSPRRFFCKACRRFIDPARDTDTTSAASSPAAADALTTVPKE